MIKIPLTIEELINMGNFEEKELEKIYSEITKVIINIQHLERNDLMTIRKPGFWERLLN